MVLRGSLKHLIFMWWGWGGWRGGNQKQYIGGGNCQKRGEHGQFADLRREGLAKEEGGGVFEEFEGGGGWGDFPLHTMHVVFLLQTKFPF